MSVVSAQREFIPGNDKTNNENLKQALVMKSEDQYISTHSKLTLSEKGKSFWKVIRLKLKMKEKL